MFSLLKLEFYNSIKAPKIWKCCLLMMAFTLFLFPTPDAGYAVIDIDGYRGLYNAAWMGESSALVSSWILMLLGFYIVVGDITKARETGLLAIMLSARMSTMQFILLKGVSRLSLLLILNASMLITAFVQQQFLGESTEWRFLAYIVPNLVLVIPSLLLAVAFSLLFETVKGLHGKSCNALYFVVWMLISTLNIFGFSAHSTIASQMELALGQSSGLLSGTISIGMSPIDTMQQTFLWNGANYDLDIILSVCFQILVAMLVVFIATISASKSALLMRNDTTNPEKKTTPIHRWGDSIKNALSYALMKITRQYPVLQAELNVLIAGLTTKQISALVAVSCLALIMPYSILQSGLLVYAAIVPIFMLSQLSVRDKAYGTHAIVQAAISVEQIACIRWLASTMLLGIIYSMLFIRLAIVGDYVALLHLLGFIFFVPAFALVLATICKTNKVFELSYLVIWFAGSLNKQAAFDVIGTTGSTNAMLNTWIALGVTMSLFAVSHVPSFWFFPRYAAHSLQKRFFNSI
jgi:hypothetical protein